MGRWQKPGEESPCSANHDDRPSRSSLDYSTPLRSVRGNATSPSPFYKLSSELSQESLRIPGAIPFMWEQSPGRRKISGSIVSTTPLVQAQLALPKVSTPLVSTDLAKPTLRSLFQQSSLEWQGAVAAAVSPSEVQSQLPQITQPPAMECPRSSSARYSSAHHNMLTSLSTPKSAFHDEFADAASDSASDAITATAGVFSIDDSQLMISGPMRPTSTPREARDFIMHRFLPAAHTIARDSPQTPSRRFLPLGASAGPMPVSPLNCNGRFQDCGGVACTRSSLISGSRCKTNNSLVYTSPSSMPPLSSQFLEGSFHSAIDEFNDSSDEEEEEPPFTPKVCGIFPFHIHISIQSRNSNNRSRSSSKHLQRRKQQLHKKNSKATSYSDTPKRIMDVLREDQSSSYEDESPVHPHKSRNLVAERERSRIAVLRQAAMHTCGDPCRRPPYSSDRYYRANPHLQQNGTLERSLSDLNNEEASEYVSFYDASSRFCSPSPAGLHPVNARALRSNVPSSLTATPQHMAIGLIDGNPHFASVYTNEQHLLNSSICFYNTAHKTLNSYHSQLASPCSCFPTPPSTVSSFQDSSNNQENITKVAPTVCDAFSRFHQHSEQRTHIINNALYEHEDQETNTSSDVSRPSMLSSYVAPTSNGIEIHHGSETHEVDAYAGDDVHAGKKAENFMKGVDHFSSFCSQTEQYVSNGDVGQDEHKGDTHYVSHGDNHACNGVHYAYDHSHCAGNGGHHACQGAHYVCNASVGAQNEINGENNIGNSNEAKMSIHGFSSNRLAPPLPKSPTHSWLDRAAASAVNKTLKKSSRFCNLHKKAEQGPFKENQASPRATADSKWEALVKGSHLQPGHLRFSKELFHRSQTIVSGAS
ncbi:hypothetical protein L7F22_045440 [Adiantum nelumboides]|nr:hypothetical protein [Adiantum nelumboides]